MKKTYISILLAATLIANEDYKLEAINIIAPMNELTSFKNIENVKTITKKDIERIKPENMGELLWHITGVSIATGTGSGLPNRSVVSLNGLPANYTLVLVDGVPLLSDHIHSGQNLDLISPSSVERIEILKGAASARYGSDAIGGVVNIITRKFKGKDEKEIEVSYSRYNTSEVSIGAISSYGESFGFSGFLNYKKSDGLPIVIPTHRVGNTGYEKLGFLGRLDYFINDNTEAFIWFNVVENEMDWRNNTTEKSLLVTKVAGITHDVTSNLEITGQISHSDWKASVSDDKNTLLKTELYSLWRMTNTHTLSAGVDFKENEFKRNAVNNAPKQQSVGVFIQDAWQVLGSLSLMGALRYDNVKSADSALSPKLSALYEPIDEIKLRGSVSKGFRSPTVQELYEEGYGHGGRAYRFGNENLKPEYSTTYSIGIDYLPKDDLIFSINTFYNDMRDMIVPVYKGAWAADPSIDVWERTNISDAEVYGLELSSKYRVTENTRVEIGYTYTKNKDKKSGKQLPYSPGESVSAKIENDLKLGKFTIKSFISAQGAYNREAWSWKPEAGMPASNSDGLTTPLKDYIKVDVGVAAIYSKNYEIFIKANNILSQDIENLDDSYTRTEGEPYIKVGVKIAFFGE